MGISASGSTTFTNNGTAVTCVELGVHARGTLQRLIVAKVSGTTLGGTVKIYDRRGACVGQPDLEVKSGAIVSLTDSSSFVRLTSATAHGLGFGDRIEFKDAARVTYPGIHTVTAKVSDTVVDLNVAYTANAAGIWQTEPWVPTQLPQTHLILVDTVSAEGEMVKFDLNRGYENRDNQDSISRRRSPSLWLEYTPAEGSGACVFHVAYTSVSDSPL
jgi:hypothetical protein